jgi:hypothetical protein
MKAENLKKCRELKNERLQLGLANEFHYDQDVKECFEEYGNIKHTEGRFDFFDWECDNAVFELKARMCVKRQYATTLVGKDKVEKGFQHIKNGKQVFFLFAFLDTGLCYWELTEQSIKDLEIKVGGCYIRQERKEHLHIPVDRCIDICDRTPITNAKYTQLKKKYDLIKNNIKD